MIWSLRSSLPGAVRAAAVLLAMSAAGVLAGCSSHAIIDSVPTSIGGLPEAARERPATPPEYPAVHDIPPSRAEGPLSVEERKKLKDDLIATRERAARKGGHPVTTGSTRSSGTARDP